MVVISGLAVGHGGGLDAKGCHHVRKNGGNTVTAEVAMEDLAGRSLSRPVNLLGAVKQLISHAAPVDA